MEDSGQILVAEVPGFDYDEEVPIPEFDFDEFEYDYLKTENNEVVVHTFTVKDEAVLGALEGIIPDYGTVSRFEMELIFIVDKAKEELRNMNMYITMLFQNLKIDMEMLMKINKFGSDVELEILSKFTEAIAEYEKSKQEDSEPNDSEPVNYKDTEDGVVDYNNLSYHKKIVYDGLTDKLAVLRSRKIDIYDAETMELEIEINVGQYPKYIDADQGKLVIGYGTDQIDVYDLKTNSNLMTLKADAVFSELAIDAQIIIYADKDDVYFHNYLTGEKQKLTSLYNPLITLNRKEHLLYITETGLSSSELYYCNTQTGKIVFSTYFGPFRYVRDRIVFNGKYLLHEGKLFNRFDGIAVREGYLSSDYPKYGDFVPEKTIYENDKLSFVGSKENQNRIAVFDKQTEQFVYQISMDYDSVLEMKAGKFLALSQGKRYVAVIDVGKISADFKEEEKVHEEDEVLLSEDGKALLKTGIYSHSMAAGGYLYVLNELSRTLKVYDATLAKVKSLDFEFRPTWFDVAGNKLVIGFGTKNQFRVYDVGTWEYETFATESPAHLTFLYGDKIIYAADAFKGDIYEYDLRDGIHAKLPITCQHSKMAFDRENGLLFTVSGDFDVHVYDLANEKVIAEFGVEGERQHKDIFFDGNFLHARKKIIDIQGTELSENEVARAYEHPQAATPARTIFDNGEISVYTAYIDNEYLTYVYDLNADANIYEIRGKASNACLLGNALFIFDDGSGPCPENSIGIMLSVLG